MTGRIHSIESMGTLDGPGVRTVIFMQGCNMRCLYCHNRDSWDISGGKEITVDEVVTLVESCKSYYGKKGGVTFSGGEPLLQSRFLVHVSKQLKEMGIHIAIDTSGSVFSEESKELLRLADLVILDIKHSDPQEFKRLCSFSAENLLGNLQYLQKGETPYWIRQVVVEGFTDSEAQIDKLSQMIYSGRYPDKTELLPYHAMGIEKWEAEGDIYQLKGIRSPTEELINQLSGRLFHSGNTAN